MMPYLKANNYLHKLNNRDQDVIIFRPYWAIVAITLFFPFEDFILKWLPFSNRLYSISRFGSEAFLLVTLAVVVLNRIWKRLPLRRTPIDVLLGCFILIAAISIFLNDASFLRALINLNALLRYLAIYYIIVNLNINESETRKLIKIMVVIAIVESFIGIMQHLFGISRFWFPRETDFEVAGFKKEFVILKSGVEIGAAIGTFGWSVSLAFYILINSIILLGIIFGNSQLSTKKRTLIYIILTIFLSVILFTYSRITFFAIIFAFPLMLVYSGKKIALLKLLFMLIFLFSILLFISVLGDKTVGINYIREKKEYANPVDHIRMIFSEEYFIRKKEGRQWILQEVGKTVLGSGSLIGFSADDETAKKKIVDHSKGALKRLISFTTFEDVYWVAMLSYFGFIGLGLFIWILYRLYCCSKLVGKYAKNYIFRSIGLYMTVYIALSFLLNFINRPFENRISSYYFWLFAGLVMTEYYRIKLSLNNIKRS